MTPPGTKVSETAPSKSPGEWRVGVDVGGTFTDLVVRHPDGSIHVFKVLSVPDDPGEGVLAALDRAAESLDRSVHDFLAECAIFVHGSTIATNILVERKGARVGMLTGEGFRDSLEIRRGMRHNPWDHRTPFPPVLVPRYLRLPVRGRIDRNGEELLPLETEDVTAAAGVFKEEGVESVAICLFNSFLDAHHEQRCAEALRAAWDGQWISLSSEIVPVMGEYERGSTAVMNAYLAPRTVSYLRALDRRLTELGFNHPILMFQNNGGAISVSQAGDRPVTLLLSGPAAGVGALEFYSRALGDRNLISMEIGGTSCDAILMSEGRVAFTDRLEIGDYHLAVPAVDVHTVGAGGGTIARVDSAGLLSVGPDGAGARPGPACYGLGGTEPTVTDAQLVLGRFKAGTYAGGTIKADENLARRAIEDRVAKPLGIDVEEAATGIIRLMEQKLLQAIQRISSERGHDPRRFTLVAAGGAGPLHGSAIGRLLGCPRVFVPRLAGAFCALGMLNSEVRHDYVRVHLARFDNADMDRMEVIFGELEREGRETLSAEGFAAGDTQLLRALDLRYIGQQWEINVPLANGSFDVDAVRRDFEAEHERLFGHIQPGGIIEITMLRVVGEGRLPPLTPPSSEPVTEMAEPTERRSVWVDETTGWAEIPVYEGDDLGPGSRIVGPAIINEQTMTTLIGVGDQLRVDGADNFVIDLPSTA